MVSLRNCFFVILLCMSFSCYALALPGAAPGDKPQRLIKSYEQIPSGFCTGGHCGCKALKECYTNRTCEFSVFPEWFAGNHKATCVPLNIKNPKCKSDDDCFDFCNEQCPRVDCKETEVGYCLIDIKCKQDSDCRDIKDKNGNLLYKGFCQEGMCVYSDGGFY